MLIHTTTYTDIHDRYRGPVAAEIRAVAEAVASGDAGMLASLRELWERESARLPAEVLGQEPTAFTELVPQLGEVTARARVVVDNYRSQERLAYPEDAAADPLVAVVVGGNTLSRGLTLEGLVVSFFLRTASAYDTLLQMGRWFGYRPGYPDLPRIWMTSELYNYFQFLAIVEQEIRTDIERYEAEHKTPLQLVTKVRTHHTLSITSPLKMRAAAPVDVSFNGARLQTFIFAHHDRAWLDQNLEVARSLVADSKSAGAVEARRGHGNVRLSRVPVSLVDRFLGGYQFHERGPIRPDPIRAYIAKLNEFGELREWNVMVMGRLDSPRGSLDLGLEAGEVGLIERSRLKLDEPYANIKSLMSRVDRVIDLDVDTTGLHLKPDDELVALRTAHDGPGLLLLYPISKDSQPKPPTTGKSERAALEAVQDVIGVGLVFPETRHVETTVEYMAVVLPPEGELEEEEWDPEAVDTEQGYSGGAAQS